MICICGVSDQLVLHTANDDVWPWVVARKSSSAASEITMDLADGKHTNPSLPWIWRRAIIHNWSLVSSFIIRSVDAVPSNNNFISSAYLAAWLVIHHKPHVTIELTISSSLKPNLPHTRLTTSKHNNAFHSFVSFTSVPFRGTTNSHGSCHSKIWN